MAPIIYEFEFQKLVIYGVFLLIGFAFGYVLEIAGFGNSKKLAAQFYFKDITVLKVMFTGIIVAMVLIFWGDYIGILDYNLLWVNPTYLWPGIIGGLIMGFGFIIGGFCPGTSIVAAATLKLDGIFFLFGVMSGILLFGETVDSFDVFWNSSYMGRLTLMDWLNISPGWVVFAVVAMAIFMFWGGEKLEDKYGDPEKLPAKSKGLRIGGAAVLLTLALTLALVGPVTNADRWEGVAEERQPMLDERAVFVMPGEVLATMHNDRLRIFVLDVRDEGDYNLFHLEGSENVSLENLEGLAPQLSLEPSNTVFLLISNDEERAVEAWRILSAERVPNVYIIEGGINYWLETFDDPHDLPGPFQAGDYDDTLRYDIEIAIGGRHPAASPDPHEYDLDFVERIILQLRQGPTSGGCG